MSRQSILKPGQSYTFRSYFEMPYEPDDILAEFGYQLQRTPLNLPKSTAPAAQIPFLKAQVGTTPHLRQFDQRNGPSRNLDCPNNIRSG